MLSHGDNALVILYVYIGKVFLERENYSGVTHYFNNKNILQLYVNNLNPCSSLRIMENLIGYGRNYLNMNL